MWSNQFSHKAVEPAFLEGVHRVLVCVLAVLFQPIIHNVLIVDAALDGFLQPLAVVVAILVRNDRCVSGSVAPYADVACLGLDVYPCNRWSLWITV